MYRLGITGVISRLPIASSSRCFIDSQLELFHSTSLSFKILDVVNEHLNNNVFNKYIS